MLGHRLRRWPNIKPTFGERLWFAGNRSQQTRRICPLSRHDTLKHLFTSLKTDLIFLQPRVFELKFP